MSFDVVGALPAGTVVLEASAGTGKTFTIAALAARYVAEVGVPLSELMLVTFGRAATVELRERTRQRLASAARGLGDAASARSGDDLLLRHLATGTDAEVLERQRRLVVALSDFDAATITTTHSFCQRMLERLGIAGDREPGAQLVESVEELVTEAADDLYLRAFAGHDAPRPQLSPSLARTVARTALADRQAVLVPTDAAFDSPIGQRVALANAARAEVERRKRVAGLRDFDDLLVLLRDALAHPEHGEAGCERVRERYRVVLVDEFQDTDPVQWEVLRRAFHGHTTLVLIGDPKQAIYAFRGAEVLSYLEAVRLADQHETLGTNWRTDADLLRALDHLYGGAALGHPDIVVHPVAPAFVDRRLALPAAEAGTGLGAPLRLRWLDRTGSGRLNRGGFPAVPALRPRVAADLAGEVVALLTSGAQLDGERPVQPGDLAVLVRNHKQSAAIGRALDAVDVPSVVTGSVSVFDTPAATDWHYLLKGLEQPQRTGLVRLAGLTALVGRRAEQLDDRATTEISLLLRELGRLLAESGFAAAFERLATRTDLDARLLGQVGGERRLTDLRHVGQLLNRAAVEGSLGLSALTAWLAERIANPHAAAGEERSRRLESDAAAVHIITVHTSKGLEFPVVYVPFGWDGARNWNPDNLLLHDPQGRRIRDIGGDRSPGYRLRHQTSEQEGAGEELRLLYVALTRAKSQVVTWWAPGATTEQAPLHRLLFGRTPDGALPEAAPAVPADAQLADRLGRWAAPAAELVSVEKISDAASPPWTAPTDHPPALDVARFARPIDLLWRRTSYSALTAAAHEGGFAAETAGVGSEPESPALTDEPADESPAPLGVPVDRTADPTTTVAGVGREGELTASSMNGLPSGPVFGTLVHEVFELVDPQAVSLDAEVLERSREVIARRGAAFDAPALAAGLLPVFRTPFLGTSLAAIETRDRLAEMDFELPLAGGDSPAAQAVTLAEIARLLRERLPAGDPLAAYPDRLAGVGGPPLRGYLTGSIDAVLRLPAGPGAGEPRYLVVDYKTNRLAAGDLTVGHYTRAAMAAEMIRAHYPLQALLYGVALHRYLRWRQPGYDPAEHLGPIAYLFVRGMVGAATPAGCGVFDWQPPAGLIPDLSDLLAGK